MATDINEDDVRKFLELMNHEKQTEVRAIIPKIDVKVFHCNNADEVVKVCREFNERYNLYAGINERTENGTSKADVKSVGIIAMDVDSVNKPATEDDLKAVQEVVDKISNDFIELGFQKLSIVFSGNGFQLYNKIPKITITDDNRQEIEDKITLFGETLIKKYSNDKARLDNIYDLPRIMRIPGTINLKSKTTSKIIEINNTEDSKLRDTILNIEIPVIQTPDWTKYERTTIGDQIPITDLVDMSKLKQHGDEWWGVHPIHGSTGGMNFFVNPSKNMWHCFRDNSGGDALSWLAVKDGICDCKNFTKGGKKLKGEEFKKTLAVAKERFNIKESEPISNKDLLAPDVVMLKDLKTKINNIDITEENKELETHKILQEISNLDDLATEDMLEELHNKTKYKIPVLRKILKNYRKRKSESKVSNSDLKPRTSESNDVLSNVRETCLNYISQKNESLTTETIVEYILENNFIYTTKNDLKEEVWIYDDGIYLPNGKSSIRAIVRNILGCFYTEQRANRIIAKIETDTYVTEDKFFNINYKDEIPVLNGILNVVTWQLSPFDPKKVFFAKIPVKYDPLAKCLKIDKFLSEILREGEDIIVIQEVAGYGLYKENSLETHFILHGDGRNGKTKLTTLLKTLYGDRNVCCIPLDRIKGESFSLSELHGKVANIAGDLREFTITDTGILKMLAGRDPIGAKRKFLRDIFFTPYAKHIFACNTLPKVYDLTLGFWSKWVLLDFPHTFMTKEEFDKLSPEEQQRISFKEKDPNIIEKITSPEEMSGFLNEALIGLRRILKNNKFSTTKGTEEIKEEWIRNSDSCMAFCMDCIVENVDGSINKKDFRRKYSNYCRQHRIKSTSDKGIKINLENMFGATEKQIQNGDRFWEGITWKKQ